MARCDGGRGAPRGWCDSRIPSASMFIPQLFEPRQPRPWAQLPHFGQGEESHWHVSRQELNGPIVKVVSRVSCPLRRASSRSARM